MEAWMIGLISGGGALAYNAWGFLEAYAKTKKTTVVEFWDPLQTVLTVVPSVVAGFLAGYNLTPSSATDYVGIFVAGFGVASAAVKVGVNNFFRS